AHRRRFQPDLECLHRSQPALEPERILESRVSIATAHSALRPRDCGCDPHTNRSLHYQKFRRLRSTESYLSASRRAFQGVKTPTLRPIPCLRDLRELLHESPVQQAPGTE